MAKKLKDVFGDLSDEQRKELISELPTIIAGMTPEERKALDIKEPEPAKPPKPKTLMDKIDEWLS